MKHSKIMSDLFKYILLTIIMNSCNYDNIIAPVETNAVKYNAQNAKINSELKLTNNTGAVLQYIKSGRFTGRISKVSASNYKIEYSYDNNNPAGDLWINRKLYAKPSNKLIEDYNYQVSNGLCISSEDVKHNVQYQYKYNAHQLLEEVKWGGKTETYTYGYSAATNSYRLAYLTRVVNHLGKIESMDKFTIFYTEISDKYPMNLQLIPFNGIDEYLPIYGKFSDVLPKEIYKDSVTPSGAILQGHREYSYGLDGDGYVTSKTVTFPGNVSPWNFTYSYSSNWQGVP